MAPNMKLHQDVEGHKAGETVDVPLKRARFYEQEGYAVPVDGPLGDDVDGVYKTSVKAKDDPRLADNQTKTGGPNASLREQLAEGLGTPTTPQADPVGEVALDRPDPVERTNGEGNPVAAEKGKARAEDKAEDTDPEEAPEVAGETPDDAEAKADKGEKAAERADASEDVQAPETTPAA